MPGRVIWQVTQVHLTQDPFIKEAGDKWHSIDSTDNIEKLSYFIDL